MSNQLFEQFKGMDRREQMALVGAGVGALALLGAAVMMPRLRQRFLGAAERTGRTIWGMVNDKPGAMERVGRGIDNGAERIKGWVMGLVPGHDEQQTTPHTPTGDQFAAAEPHTPGTVYGSPTEHLEQGEPVMAGRPAAKV